MKSLLKNGDVSMTTFREGDRKTWNAFYACFSSRLSLYLARYTKDKFLLEDAISHAFARCWVSKEDMHSAGETTSYLFTVARNRLIDHLRHQRMAASYEEKLTTYSRMESESPAYFEPDEGIAEEWDLVKERMKDVPPRGKQVVELMLCDYNTIEISKMLSISPQTVRNLKARAVQQLRADIVPSGSRTVITKNR